MQTGIKQDKQYEILNKTEVLMAKLSNFAYTNIRKLKNGSLVLKKESCGTWEYFQPNDISQDLKCKVFCVVNNETKELVIVFRGSEPLPSFDLEGIVSDWGISDFNMVVGKLPLKFLDFYNYVKTVKNNTDYKIYMTGHSLGGSIVQLLCALDENKDISAYTYNAYGIRHLLEILEKEGFCISSDFNNINNFSVSVDLVSNHNKHVGNIYIIKYDKSFIQTILCILSELPKILYDVPFKIIKSIKYYISIVNLFFVKINGHLMNNFIHGFKYEKYQDN